MRVGLQLVAYLVLLFLAAAIVSPPVYSVGRTLVEGGWVPSLDRYRYPVYFSRALQVLALSTFWWFLRASGVRSWSDLGLRPNVRARGDLGAGVLVGLGGLSVVAGMIVMAGVAGPRAELPWDEVPAILLAALLVPVIEETLFRGALLGLLRRAMGVWSALFVISAIYATLHFLKWKPGTPRGAPVEWDSGFALIAQMLWPFTDLTLLLGGWGSLFVAGLILGDCVVRRGSLHLAIGVHAGWVLGLRAFEELFTRPATSLWIGRRLTTGLAPLLMLLVTWLVLRRWMERYRPPVVDPGASGPGCEGA